MLEKVPDLPDVVRRLSIMERVERFFSYATKIHGLFAKTCIQVTNENRKPLAFKILVPE